MSNARWYDGILFPRETQTLLIQDFVDYVAYHPKEFWDVATDFPDLTPRNHPIFLHGRAPEFMNSEVHGFQRWPADRARAWGIFFDSVDIRARWIGRHKVFVVDFSSSQPDEYVIDGEEAKRLGRWNVVASLVEDMPVLGGWSVRPTARWRYLVDDDGALVSHRGHHYFGPEEKNVESVLLAENRLPLLFPMLLALTGWNEGAAVIKRQGFSRERQLRLRPGPFPADRRERREDLAG
jgi:hypothetical protein